MDIGERNEEQTLEVKGTDYAFIYQVLSCEAKHNYRKNRSGMPTMLPSNFCRSQQKRNIGNGKPAREIFVHLTEGQKSYQ